MPAPLHRQQPTTRFADRAGDYARYRPTYPDAAIDLVLAGLGRPSRLVAADVGAGTGISARLLAERGVRVLAVEPNPAMREAAQHNERVTFRDGTAEATGLADGSVDLVLCAQAFHWFQPGPALAEFARVLRAGGRLALVWNDRDEADPLTRDYGGLIRAASRGHEAAERFDHHAPLRDAPLFVHYRAHEVPHVQRLDLDGFLGRARSASYIPKEGPAWEALEAGLRGAFARHREPDDLISIRYLTHVYLAERA